MVVNKGKVSAKEGKEELVEKTLSNNLVEGVYTAKDSRKRETGTPSFMSEGIKWFRVKEVVDGVN